MEMQGRGRAMKNVTEWEEEERECE